MLNVAERHGSAAAHRRLARFYREVAQSQRSELDDAISEEGRTRLKERIAHNEGRANFYDMLANAAERRAR
jgi:hypothetical protein